MMSQNSMIIQILWLCAINKMFCLRFSCFNVHIVSKFRSSPKITFIIPNVLLICAQSYLQTGGSRSIEYLKQKYEFPFFVYHMLIDQCLNIKIT